MDILADVVSYRVDVSGEFVRSDITEGQDGVELVLDIQVVDTTTCEVLSNVAVEAWACNSTVSHPTHLALLAQHTQLTMASHTRVSTEVLLPTTTATPRT